MPPPSPPPPSPPPPSPPPTPPAPPESPPSLPTKFAVFEGKCRKDVYADDGEFTDLDGFRFDIKFLHVRNMYGGGSGVEYAGEYEDCVCNNNVGGGHSWRGAPVARAATVGEAIAGRVAFPEAAVPDGKFLTFACRDEPSEEVCSVAPGSDKRGGLEPTTPLPSSGGVRTDAFDIYRLSSDYASGNGLLLCVRV